MSQPENPMPYKEPELGLGWLKRQELGPIWVILLALFMIVASPLLAPPKPEGVVFNTSLGSQIFGIVVVFTGLSLCLFLLPNQFQTFKRFMCRATTALLVVTTLVYTVHAIRARMVWHQNLPEHTPCWDGVHKLGEALVLSVTFAFILLPIIVVLAWLWVWFERRAELVEAEKRMPRKADPTDV